MSTLQQFVLGRETEYNGMNALVVRLVQAQTVFEGSDGKCIYVDEQYVELKMPDGTPEFISLQISEREFDKSSTIKALDPVWRPKKGA